METQVTMNVPLSELKGTGFSGEPLTLTLQKTHLTKAQPTVLFVLSPECKFCAANWVNWHSLLKDSGAKSRWQPVFLDVGPLVNADYLQRHEIDKSTLFQTVSGDTKLNFRLYSTPETIIVDKTGRARGVWRGTLNAKQMTEIRTLLSQL